MSEQSALLLDEQSSRFYRSEKYISTLFCIDDTLDEITVVVTVLAVEEKNCLYRQRGRKYLKNNLLLEDRFVCACPFSGNNLLV